MEMAASGPRDGAGCWAAAVVLVMRAESPTGVRRSGCRGPLTPSGGDAVDEQRQRLVSGVDAEGTLERLERAGDAGRVVGAQLEQRLPLGDAVAHPRRPDHARG